jgi:hypothetical protein
VVVPAATAQVLLSAASQPPGERLAAINSEDLRVARLFVRRATCCDPMVLLAEAPQQMGESEEELYLAVRQAIAEAVGVFEPDVLAPDDLRQLDRPLIVLIRRRSGYDDRQGIPHEVLSRVLARLRRELDTCVFLVLTGSEYDKDLRALIGLPGLAEPPLQREDAAAWSKMINRLYRQAGLEVMA